MFILTSRITLRVTLNGRLTLLTSTLLSRGGISPRTTFPKLSRLESYYNSLICTSSLMSTYPRTTKCPRTRPPTQYKFLDFSSLQLLLLLFWLKKEQKNTLQLLLLL